MKTLWAREIHAMYQQNSHYLRTLGAHCLFRCSYPLGWHRKQSFPLSHTALAYEATEHMREPASDMALLDIVIFIFTGLYNKGWDKTLSKQMGKVHAHSCSSQATSYWHTCSFGKRFCSQRLRLRKAAVAGLDDELGALKPVSMRTISPESHLPTTECCPHNKLHYLYH